MQKDSILYILTSNGVSDEDLKTFSLKLKDKKFTVADCDKLLVKMGYDKIFTADEEDEDDVENDSFIPYEKTKSKHQIDN